MKAIKLTYPFEADEKTTNMHTEFIVLSFYFEQFFLAG